MNWSCKVLDILKSCLEIARWFEQMGSESGRWFVLDSKIARDRC